MSLIRKICQLLCLPTYCKVSIVAFSFFLFGVGCDPVLEKKEKELHTT